MVNELKINLKLFYAIGISVHDLEKKLDLILLDEYDFLNSWLQSLYVKFVPYGIGNDSFQ